MVESGPLTPGQVSFLLGFIPVFTAWLYSEILEHRKSSTPLKVHSDTNLVELGNEAVNEGDHAMLLEAGLSKSASAKFQSASIRTTLIRFATMDESFLGENRALLRAMSEFGGVLVYFYISDRTNLFSETNKSYSRDLFVFLYLLLIIASAMTSLKKHHDKSAFSGKSILYLNRHQTEEWKGWMQKTKIFCPRRSWIARDKASRSEQDCQIEGFEDLLSSSEPDRQRQPQGRSRSSEIEGSRSEPDLHNNTFTSSVVGFEDLLPLSELDRQRQRLQVGAGLPNSKASKIFCPHQSLIARDEASRSE